MVQSNVEKRHIVLTVNIVSSVSGVAELEPEFARLQSVSCNTLPFACFAWQSTWCRHFLGLDPTIRDEPMFHVFRDQDGRCVGIVPLIRTTRRLGRFNVCSLGLLGADPAITEIRTTLLQPGCEQSVAVALKLQLQATQDWDWIEWLSPSNEFGRHLGQSAALEWQPLAPSYVLDLPATWEVFHAGLKRNIRESLRHCYNSLKRDGHAFELRIAAEPAGVRGAVDRLFDLHTRRANMQNGVAHANRFASPAVRNFLQDACAEFAARDGLRIFEMEIAGQIVASRIGFVVGDSLYLYYSGFDPEWSRYSVMTTTVAEAIKYAIAQGLKTVNLSPGKDVSKTRWGPREEMQQIAYEHSGRLRSRLVRHAYLKARSGEGLQGWLLQHLVTGRRTWN